MILLLSGCFFTGVDLEERLDRDGDGFYAVELGGDDCDDDDRSVYPGAPETCDGRRTDCSGPDAVEDVSDADGDGFSVCAGDCDDLDPAVNPATVWYQDRDGDGFGVDSTATPASCSPPEATGWVTRNGDCDDELHTVHPDIVETGTLACNGLDDDCNPATNADDVDQDGDGAAVCAGDCDDTDPAVHPGTIWYPDADADGFGDADAASGPSCEPPVSGWLVTGGDCDDHEIEVNPSVDESAGLDCNGRDDDCSPLTFAADVDGDGDGYSVCTGDCDDADDVVSPGEEETGVRLCNGIDDDCDPSTAPDDVDGDGDGYTTCGADCDDTDPDVSPDADEDDPTRTCNGIDDDCDPTTFPLDADLDGDGYVACDDDCDDHDPDVSPAVDEAGALLCNGVDDDCDSSTASDDVDADGDGYLACADDCDDTDPHLSPDTLWYADLDHDTVGDDANTTTSCTMPADHVRSGGDCNPQDGTRWNSSATVTPAGELQATLDSVCDGGTLTLSSGTYTGASLTIARPITLVGHGATLRRPLSLNDEVTLQDLVFEDDGTSAACLQLFEQAEVMLLDVDFDGCDGVIAGAMSLFDGASLTWSGGSATDCVGGFAGVIDATSASIELQDVDLEESDGATAPTVFLVASTMEVSGGTWDTAWFDATSFGGPSTLDISGTTFLTPAAPLGWTDSGGSLTDVLVDGVGHGDEVVSVVRPAGGFDAERLQILGNGSVSSIGIEVQGSFSSGPVDLTHVAIHAVGTGVSADSAQLDVGFATLTGIGFDGIRLYDPDDVRIRDTIVEGNLAFAYVLESGSEAQVELVNAHAMGVNTFEEVGLSQSWAACEALDTTPPSACTIGNELVDPPDDLHLPGGSPLLGQVSSPGLCQGLFPPHPCFQPGFFGGTGSIEQDQWP